MGSISASAASTFSEMLLIGVKISETQVSNLFANSMSAPDTELRNLKSQRGGGLIELVGDSSWPALETTQLP